MKKITEYIEQYKYKHPSDLMHSFESFLENNHINEVNDEQMNWFVKNIWDKRNYECNYKHTDHYINLFDYITEMQKSMNVENLLKALNRDFADKYGKIILKPGYDLYKESMPINVYIPIEIFNNDWQKFQEKLNAYMWYEAKHYDGKRFRNDQTKLPEPIEYKNKKYIVLRLDPIQSEDVSDYIYNNCNGIVYHVPDQNKIDEIKKSGLRMKGSKATYKFMQDRVHFVTGDDQEYVIDNLKQIFEDKLIDNPNPIIIKVNLKKHNYDITFYHDQEYDLEDFVYTYAYFPPKMLEFIKFKDLL